MNSIAIDIPARDWFTANHRLHRQDEARRTKAVRLTAAWMAKAYLTPMTRANIHVLVQIPTARRFDADNALPMAKAAIDGIVTDAGILPDDDSRHRPVTSYELGEPTRQKGMYRLTLTLEELPCDPS